MTTSSMTSPATDGLAAGQFASSDGTLLYHSLSRPAGTASAVALIVHGYADHGGRYQHVADWLTQRGLAVVLLDYRGHGRAGGARGFCRHFDEYVHDLERASEVARAVVPGVPLVWICHSHGALIALYAMCQESPALAQVAATVLTSPYLGLKLKVSPLKTGVARLTSSLVPRLALKSGIEPRYLSHDPEMVGRRTTDRLCHEVATARWFTESTRAQTLVFEQAPHVVKPTLWMLAGADVLADPDVSRAVYQRLGGKKSIKEYPDFYHEVLHEAGREQAFADLHQWLLPFISKS